MEWNEEWFTKAQKKADELGFKWCMANGGKTLVMEVPNFMLGYPMYDRIEEALGSIQLALDAMKNVLNERGPFLFVGTGTSGTCASTIGAILRPKSKIVHIRKKGDKSHIEDSGVWEIGNGNPIVFIDDTIETGETLLRVSRAVGRYSSMIVDQEKQGIDYVIYSGAYNMADPLGWSKEVLPKVVICNHITP